MIYVAGIAAGLAALALLLALANPLPKRAAFPADLPAPTGDSDVARAAEHAATLHPGNSGFYLLTDGLTAFSMRLAMARNAKRTIDAQYYIWEDDLTGRMLLAELLSAADRGVRVRLLIDDNPTSGLDPVWAGVTRHPNISVRLFNPLTIRHFRLANYLFAFPRLNRRMHNKSLTIDGAATLVGGRNVGDEYFGARDKGLFIDVDALAIGSVVPAVDKEFERYWACEAAYPAELILKDEGALTLDQLRQPSHRDEAVAASYAEASIDAAAKLRFDNPEEDFVWAPVQLVADDPAKAQAKARRSGLLSTKIEPLFRDAKFRIDLVSGYFVPTRMGANLLSNMSRQGVQTRIVTNGIQVTDVPVVHAGYAPYRKGLLQAGVRLFEAKPLDETTKKARSLGQTRFSGGGESVHAKTFAIDRRFFFVGSFNFDPRSALLNCEMGFVIDSPEIANAFAQILDEQLPQSTLEVRLDDDRKIVWSTLNGDIRTIITTEPGTTGLSRLLIGFLSLLPIEWML